MVIVIQMAVVVGSGVADDKHITCAWKRLIYWRKMDWIYCYLQGPRLDSAVQGDAQLHLGLQWSLLLTGSPIWTADFVHCVPNLHLSHKLKTNSLQNLQSLYFLLHSFLFCEILSVSSSYVTSANLIHNDIDTCSKQTRTLETYGMLVERFICLVLLII